MFNSEINKEKEENEELKKKKEKRTNFSIKQQNYLIYSSEKAKETENLQNETTNIDELLDMEKQYNKTETWNKLDKTLKMQKLHFFAEKYGKENNLSQKEIKILKIFFKDNLEKNKLNRTKDVNYNKSSQEITNIPSLFFNNTTKNFTLKNMDAKRISTLKSLTPKRNSEKNVSIEIIDDDDDNINDELNEKPEKYKVMTI